MSSGKPPYYAKDQRTSKHETRIIHVRSRDGLIEREEQERRDEDIVRNRQDIDCYARSSQPERSVLN